MTKDVRFQRRECLAQTLGVSGTTPGCRLSCAQQNRSPLLGPHSKRSQCIRRGTPGIADGRDHGDEPSRCSLIPDGGYCRRSVQAATLAQFDLARDRTRSAASSPLLKLSSVHM